MRLSVALLQLTLLISIVLAPSAVDAAASPCAQLDRAECSISGSIEPAEPVAIRAESPRPQNDGESTADERPSLSRLPAEGQVAPVDPSGQHTGARVRSSPSAKVDLAGVWHTI